MALTLRQRTGLELQRSLRHTNAKLHPLRSLFWECTLRCNMNCRHCGSDCTMMPGVKDMPAEDFLKVIDSLIPHVNPNETFIIITGGEALLRTDLESVGLELYRKGFPWGIVSNGYLLDKTRLESLIASGMHSITISIDGLEESHNWMRRTPQAFEKAMEAVRLLSAEREILWDVVTCVNQKNYTQLHDLKEMLIAAGVRHWRIFSVFAMGRAAGESELQLSNQQLKGLMDFIEDCRKHDSRIDVSYACEGFLGDYERKVRDHFFYCRSGIEVASIRCDGAISGCTSVRSEMSQGNIYTDDFWDVWQNRFQMMRDRTWAHKAQCATCKMWRYCEGSGLHLYDDNGELLSCHFNRLHN